MRSTVTLLCNPPRSALALRDSISSFRSPSAQHRASEQSTLLLLHDFFGFFKPQELSYYFGSYRSSSRVFRKLVADPSKLQHANASLSPGINLRRSHVSSLD